MQKSTDIQKSSEVNLTLNSIDLKRKTEEIEIRKKIENFEKNMHYFDDQPTFFVVLAHLKLKIKDLEGALNYMNEAYKISPKDEFIYENRAYVLFKLKDYNGALMNLNQAIELNPHMDSYYSRRGNALVKLKIYSGAIHDYTKAIEINNLNESCFFNRGLAKGCLNDIGGAIADLEKTLELNPNNTKAKQIIIDLRKLLASRNQNLNFTKMSGFGTLTCNSCNFSKDLVGSVHNLDLWECLGYQCQKCGKLHKINNPNDLKQPLNCKCSGHLSRENIVFCPECKSKNVKYKLKYLT